MALSAPDLDDRRFQDLVDDAKRLVQQRCPEWSDHNVHDPGVTLIESFAWMVDQLLWRLNRVPDRLYVKFLEMIGVALYPPVAAVAAQTFWLSVSQDRTVTVPRGTQVATVRTAGIEPVVFTTTTDLDIIPTSLITARSSHSDAQFDHADALATHSAFPAFGASPEPGDTLLIGLTKAIPSNALCLQMDCSVEGIGVDPRRPPLLWECFTPDGWVECEVDRDSTGGLNTAGEVVIHVAAAHTQSIILHQRAGWVRARVLLPEEGQPAYSATPLIHRLAASTVGGTVEAVNAEEVAGEIIGTSEGVAGQSFQLERSPVVPSDEGFTVEVADPESPEFEESTWRAWGAVNEFGDGQADTEIVVLDPTTGIVHFGPAVREADGQLRQYGAVPAKGATVRVPSYRYGGGESGNVAERSLAVLTGSVPYVTSTVNRRAARGGRNAETVENAKIRGPVQLRHRGRAVTAADYERIVLGGVREVARARAVGDTEASGVRVLIVPVTGRGRPAFGDLVPEDATLRRVAEILDQARILGTRLVVEPPSYQGFTVVARLASLPGKTGTDLQERALDALYRRFDPVYGGTQENGWPFGRAVNVGEIYATLQRLVGVDLVEDVRLFPADPVTGRRGEQTTRIEIDPHALVYGYEHQIRVQPAAS